MANANPIVYRAPCARCGAEVALFDQDAMDFIAAPWQGLVHFVCPEPETTT